MTEEKSWTNQDILSEVLQGIIRRIYESATNPEIQKTIQEAAQDNNPNRLRDVLINLQSGPILDLLLYLDGAVGPTYWPGIDLVNALTKETLSNDFCTDFASAESSIIDEIEI